MPATLKPPRKGRVSESGDARLYIRMDRYSCCPTIEMTKLFVGTALANLNKAELLK